MVKVNVSLVVVYATWRCMMIVAIAYAQIVVVVAPDFMFMFVLFFLLFPLPILIVDEMTTKNDSRRRKRVVEVFCCYMSKRV